MSHQVRTLTAGRGILLSGVIPHLAEAVGAVLALIPVQPVGAVLDALGVDGFESDQGRRRHTCANGRVNSSVASFVSGFNPGMAVN